MSNESPNHHHNHHHQQPNQDTFQPVVHRVHFPGPTRQPIKTIKDLHDQLNASLFQPTPETPSTITTTMSPIIAELIEKLNSASKNPPTTSSPSFTNDTLGSSALASKHFTGSSGYFVKANRFQFEKSWTSTVAPPTSPGTPSTTPPVVYFTSQRTNSYLQAPPPTKSPSSQTSSITPISSTPTSFAVPATVRVITSPSVSPGVHRPELMAARKHFGVNSGGNSGSYQLHQDSTSARHEHHTLGAASTVDTSKVASIIIGFCVAMMALAGKHLTFDLYNENP